MSRRSTSIFVTTLLLTSFVEAAGTSDTNVEFRNIADDFIFSGIEYSRKESPRIETRRATHQNGFFLPNDTYNSALKDHGAPGLAVLDFDNDGDLDIYVPNGPGRANSLYSNQFSELDITTFVDVAESAGVALTEHDSSGICYGDIDNDGDHDLLVLSTGNKNTLFENQGDGTFSDISDQALPDSTGKYSTACSMGDINNDGLLDIIVANTYEDWSNFGPLVLLDETDRLQPNQLYLNLGDNQFEERAEEAGLGNYHWVTWTTAFVDYDLDGDADLFFADDQAAIPTAFDGGTDVGFLRVYNNDGTGQFSDVTDSIGMSRPGGWMGLAFADLNSDGYMDVFATNFGDFFGRAFAVPKGNLASGWYLGNASGEFTWPGVGELDATPFGWGVVAADYDNDADTDIAFFGGIEMGPFVSGTNPGALLVNNGLAEFTSGTDPFADTDYQRRIVMGVASGDLNNDGYPDIATVSAKNWPSNQDMIPIGGDPYDSPFEQSAYTWPTYYLNDLTDVSQGFSWSGVELEQGNMSIELNDSVVNNHWVKVTPVGTVGKVDNACVNRAGIGAVLTFTPENSLTAMKPVLGGASYASQDDLTAIFGMGQEESGTLEVMWPGGVKNKLFDVAKYERINLPEIPCSYADQNIEFEPYKRCLRKALWQLYQEDMIDVGEFVRFYRSAIRAYQEFNE